MVQCCFQGCVFIKQEPGKGKANPRELEVLGAGGSDKEKAGKK